MSHLIDRTRENLIETAEQVRLATGGPLVLEMLVVEEGAQIRGCMVIQGPGTPPQRLFYLSAVCRWDDLVAKENPLPVLVEGVLLTLDRRAQEAVRIASPVESGQQG